MAHSKLALSFLVGAGGSSSNPAVAAATVPQMPQPRVVPTLADLGAQQPLPTPSKHTPSIGAVSGIDSLALVAAAAPYVNSSSPPTAPSTPTTVTALGASHGLPGTAWSESSGSTRISAELAAADMHVLAMGGSGPHVCSLCGTGFAQKLRLLHHLYAVHDCKEHAGKKIIACSRCDSAFLRNTDLKKHISCVHEKRRPHACTARGCDSRFFFAKDLKKHVSTVHERNKPFGCPKCGQRFGKREHMTSHVRRVHDKLKPFSCNVCKVPLASKYNLQGHLRTFSHKQRVASLSAAGVLFDTNIVSMASPMHPPVVAPSQPRVD